MVLKSCTRSSSLHTSPETNSEGCANQLQNTTVLILGNITPLWHHKWKSSWCLIYGRLFSHWHTVHHQLCILIIIIIMMALLARKNQPRSIGHSEKLENMVWPLLCGKHQWPDTKWPLYEILNMSLYRVQLSTQRLWTLKFISWFHISKLANFPGITIYFKISSSLAFAKKKQPRIELPFKLSSHFFLDNIFKLHECLFLHRFHFQRHIQNCSNNLTLKTVLISTSSSQFIAHFTETSLLHTLDKSAHFTFPTHGHGWYS